MSVAFTAGATGGSAITSYKYSTDGGTTFYTRASGTTDSPLVISTLSTDGSTALTNGTAYSIQIKAVNLIGDGTATASTSATPATTPSAPTGVSITASSGSLSVAFTAGATGGSAITSYKYSTDGGTTFYTRASGTTDSPLVISTLSTDGSTALTNGTAYSIQIKAVNLIGDGTATASTSATPATTPSAPTSVSGTSGDGQVSVSWSTPASNGGAAITDYIVQYSTSSGGAYTTFSDGTSTSTSATVTGLSNNTPYYFKVAAVNSAGTSSYSTVSASVTPKSVPPVVSSVTAGDGSLTFTWNAISHGGDNYRIYWGTDSTFATAYSYTGTTLTSYTVSSLTNGTIYYFRVAGWNNSATPQIATTDWSTNASGTPAS